jgi:ArsR family transcriptional regulator
MDQDGLFCLIADGTRRRILRLLLAEGPLCVCELSAALAAEQPKVSRHLARLRGAGLVEDRRAAQRVFYALPAAGPVAALLDGAAALAGPEDAAPDRARLAAMPQRPARRRASVAERRRP